MDKFIKKSIDNFKGLTSCNVLFTAGDFKVQKKLRFYFSYIKEDDIFHIISLDFISKEKIYDWSVIERGGQEAVVAAINESISQQLSFFVAYYKDNYDNKANLSTINRRISLWLCMFYRYMKLKSKINKSVKYFSNNTMAKIDHANYEGSQGTITYMEV